MARGFMFVCLALAFLGSCGPRGGGPFSAFVKDPEVNVLEVSFLDISVKGARFRVAIELKNPNQFEIEIKDFRGRIGRLEQELAVAEVPGGQLVSMPSSQSVRQELEVLVKAEQFLMQVAPKDKADPYWIEAEGVASAWFGSTRFSKREAVNLL